MKLKILVDLVLCDLLKHKNSDNNLISSNNKEFILDMMNDTPAIFVHVCYVQIYDVMSEYRIIIYCLLLILRVLPGGRQL